MDWTQIGQDLNGDEANDYFGSSISISRDGTTVGITGILNSTDNTDIGGVKIYKNQQGSLTQVGQTIYGEHTDIASPGDEIVLSSDGSIFAYGIPNSPDLGTWTGSVRVFKNINNVWTQLGEKITGTSAYQRTGEIIALSDDGLTLGLYNGKPRIYKYVNNVWTQLGNDIEIPGGGSGIPMSFSSDGTVVIICNFSHDSNRGLLCVYEYDGINWVQKGQELVGDNINDNFGKAAKLSSDGNIFIVSAIGVDGVNNNDVGQVRVYEYDGANWIPKGQYLTGEDVHVGAGRAEAKGSSVSISSNGNVIATLSTMTNKSHIYTYQDGNWVQKGSEIINTSAIALSGDGSIALTSNSNFGNSNGTYVGLVRMYEFNLIDSLKLQNSDIDYVTKETKLEITFKTDVSDLTIDMITVDNGVVVSNLVKEGLKWIADIVFPDGVSNEAVKYTINVNYAENASKTLIKFYNTFSPIIGGTSALDIVSNIPETTTEDEKSFILPSLLNPTQLTIGTALEKRAKRKEFIKRLLKNKKEQLKSSAKKLVMNTSELLGTNDTVKKSKMRILDSYNSEGNVETNIAFDITTLGIDEGVYVPLENVGDSVLLTTTNNKMKIVKASESTYDVYEGYVDETSVVTKTMNDDETGVYDKFSYVLGSVGGELQTLESVTMEDIINPNTTGTLTITFNQPIGEANLNAYVSLNPSYIGTIGDITSADGGITYTGTITLNEGINRINNTVNLNYNGITGEASYDVVESDGVQITNQVLEKEYKDDTITKRYVAKISPDGSHVGVIDLRAGYDTLSTIIYEYDSNTNDYVQKGSVLKTGTMIEFSNDGSYVLIGAYKNAYSGVYNSKLYYYKYNTNNNDWEIKGPNDYLHYYHGSGGDGIRDISIDGTGKKIAMITFTTVRVYNYDDINDTLTETVLGGYNQAYGKISNDGNVLYVANIYLNMSRYNYNGTNWTLVYQNPMSGLYLTALSEAGINNVDGSKFNISDDGKLMAITGSRMYVPGSGNDSDGHANITLVLEYDIIINEFNLKGNIISHPFVGYWVNKSIDITGDGNRIVVGDTGMKNVNQSSSELEGKVEVYDYNSETQTWELYTRILGGGGVKDNFGEEVSITRDGLKITGTNHNEYGGLNYTDTNYNTNSNIVQEYSRIYKIERGIERTLLSMSMSDTTIKFPENGATFEVKFSTNDKAIEEIQGNVSLEPIEAGTLTNVELGNSGFSLVGTYNAPSQTETTGNKLKYVEGGLSAEVEFVLSTAEKAISNICFRGEAKVLTSEGYMEIREVKRGMKVQGEEIEEVTRTISKESEVVLMKRGSIMKNMPLEDTVITKEHKVLYKGKMVEAKELVNGSSIVYEKYKGETLYNILLSGEGKMVVNGMIVETLSPSNNIAKLYKIMKDYSEEEKEEIVKIYNEERKINGKKR